MSSLTGKSARLSAVILAAALACFSGSAALQAEGPYLHGFDAIALLPAPPVLGTPEDRADREMAYRVYEMRTPEEVVTAKAEHKVSVFAFAPAIGPFFKPDRFPKTAALFKEVEAEAKVIIDGAKETWKRPRPYVADPARFTEPGDPEKSPDYPSGHSTRGTLFALLLAEIFPAQRAAILEKGHAIGWVRVEVGVHTPLAIYGGRVLGQALAESLLRDPDFQRDFAAAKAEAAAAQP